MDVDAHRAAVDAALLRLGLGWDSWPGVVADPRLTPEVRLSAVVLLLALTQGTDPPPDTVIVVGHGDGEGLGWLGDRQPWDHLARARLPWTAGSAATALDLVTEGRYDDRRVALALRGARDVCAAGAATADLLDSLQRCIRWLDRVPEEQWAVKELRNLARRVLATATPPDLLDLSLLVEGDAWAAPAREAARAMPSEAVTPLVRLLGALGPRKPRAAWLRSVEQALRPAAARELLRRWLGLAVGTDIVPAHPDSELGLCPGALFVGTNVDVVRAAVWATCAVPGETWPSRVLGALARRGAAHNGLAGFPEALALKVATAAVDALVLRGGAEDRLVLVELAEDLRRRDLLKRVHAALD